MGAKKNLQDIPDLQANQLKADYFKIFLNQSYFFSAFFAFLAARFSFSDFVGCFLTFACCLYNF
jgi:hypothetical protein